MTWVLGWPISVEYATRYCKERGLLRWCENPDGSLYLDAAAQDIKRRSGLSKYHTPLLCYWVEGQLRLVYGLSVDRRSRSSRKAEKRLKRKRLPDRECVLRLADLLNCEDGPWWHRYDDGSWNPVDGECRPYNGSDDSDTGSEPDWFPSDDFERGEEEGMKDGKEEAGESHVHERGDAGTAGDERGDEDVTESDREQDDKAPSQQLFVESTAAQPTQHELYTKVEDCKV